MKNALAVFTQFLVASAGCVAVSQAISFGWYSEGSIVASVLRNHAIILFAAGIGLVAAGYFMRQSSARISALEEQLALLQHKNA